MIRWNSGADSIVWIEEGKTTRPMRVSVLIHAPKTNLVFGIFIGCDSRIRLRLGMSLRPETICIEAFFYLSNALGGVLAAGDGGKSRI